MKVNRRSDNRGATLILDEAELKYLYHKLNAADSRPFTQYEEKEGLKFPANFKFLMWEALDKKYHP